MKINYRKTFGKRLKQIRLLRGLTQCALSKKTGLPKASLSYYESAPHKRSPSFDNIIILCEALNVTSDYLLGLSETLSGVPIKNPLINAIYKLTDKDRDLIEAMTDKLVNN